MQLARPVLVAATLSIALGACYRERARGEALENRSEGARAEARGDTLAFLPLDAEVVIGLDARQILASPLWRRFEPRLMQELAGGLRELQAACGYDPLATLRGATLGFKASEPIDGVIVVRGLERERTMKCAGALAERGRVAIAGGVITVRDGDAGAPAAVMTFAGPSTLVIASSRARLDAALAAGAPLRGSRAFSELWTHVDPKQAGWVIVNGASQAFDSLGMAGLRPRAVIASFGLAGGLSLTGRMRLGSPDEATQLASLGQSQLGMARAMVEQVELGAEGPDVTLRVVMTTAQVESLAGLLMGAMGGMPNPLGGP